MAVIIYRHGQGLAVESVGAQDADTGINWTVFARAIESHACGLAKAYAQIRGFALAPGLDDGLGSRVCRTAYVFSIELAYASDKCGGWRIMAMGAVEANCVRGNACLGGYSGADFSCEIFVGI